MFGLLRASSRSAALAFSLKQSQSSPLRPGRLQQSLIPLGHHRCFSVTHLNCRQRDSLSSSDSGNKRGSRKKGLWEMASDKLSEVGARTRSAASRGKKAISTKAERSMGDAGYHPASRDRLADKRSSGLGSAGAREGDKERVTEKRSRSPGRSRTSSAGHQSKLSQDEESGAGRKRRSKTTSNNPVDHRATGSVRHDTNKMRFVLDLGDNQVARIDYKPVGRGRIELYHTEVPEELRGRGIGRTLARGAFEAASKADLKLKVTCSYLEDYLKRLSDGKYKNLVE